MKRAARQLTPASQDHPDPDGFCRRGVTARLATLFPDRCWARFSSGRGAGADGESTRTGLGGAEGSVPARRPSIPAARGRLLHLPACQVP